MTLLGVILLQTIPFIADEPKKFFTMFLSLVDYDCIHGHCCCRVRSVPFLNSLFFSFLCCCTKRSFMVVLTSGGALQCIIAFCYIQMSLHSQSQSSSLFVLESLLWLTLWRCILDAIKCLLQAREYNQLNCSGIWIELHFCSIYRHLDALCHSSSVINILLCTPFHSYSTSLHADRCRIFFQGSNRLSRKNLKVVQVSFIYANNPCSTILDS